MVKLIALRFGAFIFAIVTVLSMGSNVFAAASFITWKDADTIVISGGDLSGITSLKANDGKTSYAGNPTLATKNCTFLLTIYNISSDHKTAMMMAGPYTSISNVGSKQARSCTKDEVAPWNTSTGIANPQLSNTASATEDATNRMIVVTVFPNTTPTNSQATQDVPPTDTITLYFNGSVIDTKKPDANNTYACQDFDPTCKGSIQYNANFTDKSIGAYRVCSHVAANCVSFTKSYNQQAKVTVPGKNAQINATAPAPSQAKAGSDDPCATATGAYAWMLCPAFKLAEDALTGGSSGGGGIYGTLIEPILQIDPLSSTSKIKPVWTAFVQIADVLFVLAFLILIFGQTLNLDAYTIKKSLPRLVVAAIAVQISYFLCGVLIDIGNIMGSGIMDFVSATLSSGHASNSIGKDLVTGFVTGPLALLAGGITVAILGFSLITMVVGLVIAILAFFITLTIRVLILNVLILLSPLAIVAWVLPNTERYFKMWRDNFIKLVMVYPIVALILSAGYIVQKASSGTSQVDQIIAGIAPIFAFFLMPRAFKMSGSLMSGAAGAIKSKGGSLGAWGKKRTQTALDNSQYLKDRNERKLKENLTTMTDPNAKWASRKIAQRRAGLGWATTAGAMSAGYSKLENIEKSNEAGASRQVSDVPRKEIPRILEADDGATVDIQMADGSTKRIKVSEDHKNAVKRKMAEEGQWSELRKHQENEIQKLIANQGLTREKATAQVQATSARALKGTQAATQARDLVAPPNVAFENMDAERIANMHHSTLAAYANHVRSSGDPELIRDFENATTGALNSATLRSKISKESGKIIFDAANGRAATPPSASNPNGTAAVPVLMTDTAAIARVNGVPAVPATATTPYQPELKGIDSEGRVVS